MDELQRLLDIHKGSRNASHEHQEDGGQENDQEVDLDETDPYNGIGKHLIGGCGAGGTFATLSKVRGETGVEGR